MQSAEQQTKMIKNDVINQSSRLMELPPELRAYILNKVFKENRVNDISTRITLLERQMEEIEAENDMMVNDVNLDLDAPLYEMYNEQMGESQLRMLLEETDLIDETNKETILKRLILEERFDKLLEQPKVVSELINDEIEDEDDDDEDDD